MDQTERNSLDSETNNFYDKGLDFFNTGDYEQAGLSFEKSFKLTNDIYERLLWGAALLLNNESEKSIEVLGVGKNDTTYRDQFQWHLILAYYNLKDNDRLEEAICNYIAKDYDYQISKVKRIQKKMKISCD